MARYLIFWFCFLGYRLVLETKKEEIKRRGSKLIIRDSKSSTLGEGFFSRVSRHYIFQNTIQKSSSFSKILFTCCFLCCLVACKKDKCESVKVGATNLATESKKFAPYAQDEILTLVNVDGDTLRFIVTKELSTANRSCVKYLCEAFSDPFQSVPCEYYETESVRNILRSENDSILIDILVSIENYEEESTLFYEVLSIYMSEIGSLADGKWITHIQFDTPTFDINQTSIQQLLIEEQEITLLGQTFTNIFRTAVSDNMVYYQKNSGIVALKLNGIVWLTQ